MAKTRGKPRSQRKYPTNMVGEHRAYFVKGTDDKATQIRVAGSSSRMEWRDSDGEPCEVELRKTGKACWQKAN